MTTMFLALAIGLTSSGSLQAQNEPGYVQDWRATLLVEKLATAMPSETFSTAVREGQAIPFQAVPIGLFYKLKDYLPDTSTRDLNPLLFVQMNPRMYIREPETKGFYEVDLKSVPSLSISRMPIPAYTKEKQYKSAEGKLRVEARQATGRLVELMLKGGGIPSCLTEADFLAGEQSLAKVDGPAIEWLSTLASQGKDLSVKKDLGALLKDESRRSKCTVEFVVQCFVTLKQGSGSTGRAFNLP